MTRRSWAILALALLAAGCIGPRQRAPRDVQSTATLQPSVRDKDAGMVGVGPGLDLRKFRTIAVGRFPVRPSEIKDDEDRQLAALLPAQLQSELVRRLRETGVFENVVLLTESPVVGPAPVLRLEGEITKLTPGSRVLRAVSRGIGGAGRTKIQAETRFVDAQSGQVVIMTADRREVVRGLLGGSSERHLTRSVDVIARDLVRFLVRTAGPRRSATPPAVPALR